MALARFTIYVAPHHGRPGRPPAPEDDRIGGVASLNWRLLAANNRDVARSAVPFVDVEACLAAIDILQRDLASAVSVASRTGRADWAWRLRIDGQDVAVSSRTYQRRLQCEAACELFVLLVPNAAVADPAPLGPSWTVPKQARPDPPASVLI